MGYVALRHGPSKVVIVLTARGRGGPPDPGTDDGPLDHLAFAVPDGDVLAAWAGHLTTIGIAHDGVALEDGRPSLQLVDPDGVAIELVAPAPRPGLAGRRPGSAARSGALPADPRTRPT